MCDSVSGRFWEDMLWPLNEEDTQCQGRINSQNMIQPTKRGLVEGTLVSVDQTRRQTRKHMTKMA